MESELELNADVADVADVEVADGPGDEVEVKVEFVVEPGPDVDGGNSGDAGPDSGARATSD